MSSITRYPSPAKQIAQHYRDAIAAGDLTPADELPSLRKLGSMWSVAYNTAFAAVAILAREGWVKTRAGKPALVLGVPPDAKGPK